MKPVIIDCDPGYDDALALVLALGSKELDIKGLVATGGNVAIERTYKNLIRICDFLRQPYPIARGAQRPLLIPLKTGEEVHSKSGFGGVDIPEQVQMPALIGASEMMRRILLEQEQPLTVIATGPLTNLATFILAFPELTDKIAGIHIMGGSAVGGNASASAEFNIIADPHSAKIVFDSGIPIVMAGLDITNDFQIYPEEFEELGGYGKVGNFVRQILEHYFLFYQKIGKQFRGPAVHDMIPVAYTIDPTIFEAMDYHVDVECNGMYTLGQTVVDFNGINPNKNVKILQKYDRDKIMQLFRQAIDRLNQGGSQ